MKSRVWCCARRMGSSTAAGRSLCRLSSTRIHMPLKSALPISGKVILGRYGVVNSLLNPSDDLFVRHFIKTARG